MTDTVPALEQFIEPAPIKFTFGAQGWYTLALALLACALVALALLLIRYHNNRYRRFYARQLKRKESELISAKKYAELVYTSNMLMKQICAQVYTRETASELRGKAWLDFLNRQLRKNIFDQADETALLALYQVQGKTSEDEALAFSAKAKHWIMKHKHVARRSK